MDNPTCKHCRECNTLIYVDGVGFFCQDHHADWEWEQVVIPKVSETYSKRFGGSKAQRFCDTFRERIILRL